ncbi:MAG: HAMP domain-containing histidine kinase [Bacteriovoracaceae bacterium]|nr:HAMP domain-containing histidine kinase [Bacteriovoracaceae bacterium]
MNSENINNQLEISNYETETSILTLNTLIEILGKIVESESIDLAIGNMLIKICNYINFPKGIFLINKGDSFEVISSYGFEKEIEFGKSHENEGSLVWCTNDLGSSLVVADIKKDRRFDENELFAIDSETSVISYCLNTDSGIYGMFLFYIEARDQLFLRGTLEKINRIIKIIIPHLEARQKNEIELGKAYKKVENEKENAHKLLQIVGHDISNALAIIIGKGFISAERNKNNPDELRSWKTIQRASQTIAEIIETVRTIQILEKEKSNMVLEKISLNEMVEKAKFIFESQLETKKIQLVYDSKNDFFFLAEKKSFSNQVFNNLVSNAIKFSNPKSDIKILAEEINGEIHIQIKDDGIGMPEEILNELFFSRRKTSRKGTQGESGTGFGVPLVKSYMEMYGGRVEVESKDIDKYPDNHGTTFHLYLKK